MKQNIEEKIEVVKSTPTNEQWSPVIGPETLNLLEYFSKKKNMDEEGCSTIQGEAVNILSKCISPTLSSRSVTGLVVGYVQSGKTMSYTTVAALARDNGYKMIIVITGISVPLHGQGSGRLREDLRLETRGDRRWQYFTNPRAEDVTTIENTLADWDDAVASGSEPEAVLITVMKNHIYLQNLIDLLGALNLTAVPTLIIDDEADQAGLNAQVRKGGQTPTYKKLLALRGSVPHHSFLQYTATPQAPLLINIIDVLSPSFVEVLTPGKNYTGGKHFFIEKPELVQPIPESEVPTKNNPLHEPPDSLLEALRIFILGVAAGLSVYHGKNRSMLIHPSRETVGHHQYYIWVEQITEAWRRLLALNETDPDRVELINEFESTYKNLEATVSAPPAFEELKGQLLRALRKTRLTEVNRTEGDTPRIDWSQSYANILVGGQAMDRGFTVEGLTVTYMPRGSGVGNADTIQQRARFFGYKLGYLGYCRVYLDGEVQEAFRSYVRHEEDIRQRLLEYTASGKPLREWKRAFFLDSNLKPTRKGVQGLDYMRGGFSDDWYTPKAPHDSNDSGATENNRTVVDKFIASLNLRVDEGDPRRTEEQKHSVDHNVSLLTAYQELLVKLRTMPPSDSQRFTGLMLQLAEYLQSNTDSVCSVYLMSGGSPRKRSVNLDGEIPTLFQGKNYADKAHQDETYPGDSEILGQGLTIQIHNLNVDGKDGGRIASNVPAVAVWVPSDMAEDWLVQDEPKT